MRPRSSVFVLSALGSVVAGAIHAVVVPEHLEEWWLFGAFFIACAIFQFAWAVAVLTSPTRAVLLLGIVGNAAMVAIWAASRTAGLPLGPEPWMSEPVGALDLVATGLELFIVGAAAWALSATGVRRCGAALV